MSGPIVRKYGFPNFEKIFGERPILHGAEESPRPDAAEASKSDAPKSDATADGRPADEPNPPR